MPGTKTIAFIGAGKMATAIALGLIKSGITVNRIRAYDVSENAGMRFQETTGAGFVRTLPGALSDAHVVILAVKPQFAADALEEAKPFLGDKLMLSIAAGLSIKFLMEKSGLSRVVRVMPNTPALVGEGMSCYAGAPNLSESDLEIAEKILSAVGRASLVSESQLDAVTGLSGSGPAYVLEFIMGLADGGVYAGLPRDMALEMAAQTVFGTALMCLQSKAHPAELRDSVISPAGTTARGIMKLQEAGFKGITAAAVIASAERSAELSKLK